jgi:hypothetical protein
LFSRKITKLLSVRPSFFARFSSLPSSVSGIRIDLGDAMIVPFYIIKKFKPAMHAHTPAGVHICFSSPTKTHIAEVKNIPKQIIPVDKDTKLIIATLL